MKDKELIKQQKIWYKKLKEEGFRDIEYYDSKMEPYDVLHRDNIKFHTSHSNPEATFYPQEEYYIAAGRFLHDHIFDSDHQRQMWALHAEGDAYTLIASKLNSSKAIVMKQIIYLRKIMLDIHILTPSKTTEENTITVPLGDNNE